VSNYTDFSEIPTGQFDIICADPPWRFKVYSEKTGIKKSPQAHYSCLSIDDIKAFPVQRITAQSCALFLWATAPMLPQALDVMAAWGFTYKTMGAWHKRTKSGKTAFGCGYRLRSAMEPYLLGVRGNPKNTKGQRNIVYGAVRSHSEKPEEFYAMVERWLPDALRIELFSRTSRKGWSAFGDQCGILNSQMELGNI
jgi:N6-adenosine-specific RNA methylase IME4